MSFFKRLLLLVSGSSPVTSLSSAAIAFSLVISTFASANEMYDSWELQERNFVSPTLEAAMTGDDVFCNSQEYGKCVDAITEAARKAAEFQCRTIKDDVQKGMCEKGHYKEQFDKTEKGCRETDSDRGSSVKAEGKVGGSGGSVEYKSK